MTTSKERCRLARPRPDFTIEQGWQDYTAAEHERWDRLYARSRSMLQERACPEFLEGLDRLRLSAGGIPDMGELSDRLEAVSGWRVVPVAGLVPDAAFFELLAERRFPAGAFIRSEAEMDYLEEPDIFHDLFGHVPMLSDPDYAEFMQAYGRRGRSALRRGQLHNLARLYWYTIEFGLVASAAGLRICGAGILSSVAESAFALDDASPNRIGFDLERVMRTKYVIDDLQQSYFVIDSFAALRSECDADLGPLYERLSGLPDIEPNELLASDRVISRGSGAYFRRKASARAQMAGEAVG